MSFEVNCPSCGKTYAADAKMAGKKIRCRQCAEVFTVKSPDGASSASTLGREASRSGSGVVSARSAAVGAPVVARPPTALSAGAAKPATPVVGRPSGAANSFGIRPSEPQPFPASIALEAWVPLGLCVLGGAWVIAESFTENNSGAGWAPIVRLLAFAAVFFLLVVPATMAATKKTLKRHKRGMPPSPLYRVIATFILPATLAYVFSMLSGVIGFVIGSLVGLAVVAVVFWLLFRLESHETANAYAIIGGTYFGASAVGAVLLIGLATLINQGMIGSSSAKDLHENPLGPQFAWNFPAPALPPRVAPQREKVPEVGPVATPEVAPKTALSPLPPPTLNSPAPAMQAPIARTDSAPPSGQGDAPASMDDEDADPATRSGLFGLSQAADSDPFVKSIQDAKLPWVRWVFRPSEQGIYEQSLAPLTPSPALALFRLPGIGGRTIESCRLTPTYRGLGALPLGDEGADATATAGRYAITDDGSTLLRLTNSSAAKVEVLRFRGAGGAVSLTAPPEFAKATDALPPTAELLGALPGRRFLIRWSSGDQTALQVYDFATPEGKLHATLKLGQSDSPNVFGVSPDGNSFAIAEREAEHTFIVVRNFENAGSAPILFTTANPRDKSRWDCAGIAFSPDGSKLAALMEHGTDGRVRSWQLSGEHQLAEGTCKAPSADEMLGQIKGRSFDWVTEGKWLVHGRGVLDAASGALFGTLTDQVVSAQQMADDHTAYLSYLGIDGHPHIAVVKFNPAKLNNVPVKPTPK